MTENMKVFLEDAEKNEELKKKVQEFAQRYQKLIQDGIAMAAEYGFILTAADFIPKQDGEISEEELTKIAGGIFQIRGSDPFY